jgi:hypothetical protein
VPFPAGVALAVAVVCPDAAGSGVWVAADGFCAVVIVVGADDDCTPL